MSVILPLRQRMAIRSAQNKLDKSTVISIYPQEIVEKKPTTQPGVFRIPSGTYKNPGILVVGTSSWWKETHPDEPLLEIPHSSVVVAESIVTDWANGLLCCNMGDTRPGIFWVQGEKTLEEVKELKNHASELLLDVYAARQKRWFEALVKQADIMWARSRGNPMSIPDNARLAAKELKLENKPWLADYVTSQLDRCPACGNLRDNNYPVRQSCNTVIDRNRYQELGLMPAVNTPNAPPVDSILDSLGK